MIYLNDLNVGIHLLFLYLSSHLNHDLCNFYCSFCALIATKVRAKCHYIHGSVTHASLSALSFKYNYNISIQVIVFKAS